MNKVFNNFEWQNFPSIDTPLNRSNLMKINNAIDVIDDRIVEFDITKFNTVDAQTLIKSLNFNSDNGMFTITYFNGATATIDTMLEKLAVNFNFDEDAQQLVIILADGTEKRVDLSAFIIPLEFIDSDTIAFQLLNNGKVSAVIKNGSIEEKHLRPDYLADIKIETAKASSAAESAEKNRIISESFAHGGTGKRDGEETDNAKYYSDMAQKALENLEQSGIVAGVKGSAESQYRKGLVNISPNDIGLGNVGNFKAVSTISSQGLSDAEKANARTNIGAGTSSFSGKYEDLSGRPSVPSASTTMPMPNGIAAVGSENKYARGNHVHPLQTSVSGSSGSCTGNAATATKAAKDADGNDIVSTYMPIYGKLKQQRVNWYIDGDDGEAAYECYPDGSDCVHRWSLANKYIEYVGNALQPYNNSVSLGTSGNKWNAVYAASGTIQTSDRTQKTNITSLDGELIKQFFMGLIPSSYQMIDGTSGRTHWGLISQDIEELMINLGMDSKDFAGFIKSPRAPIRSADENGNSMSKPVKEVSEGEYDYSLRYDEFIAPLIKIVQMQQEEISQIKQHNLKLQQRLEKIEETLQLYQFRNADKI